MRTAPPTHEGVAYRADTPPDRGVASAPAPWPARAHARLAVAALAASSALGAFDRAIITLVGEPLRRDLGITDAQFGMVAGAAFALPLAFLAVPLGRLADRRSRKAILACGVAVWSFMTAACGAVKSLGALLVARAGVGVGEASLPPTALPILADYFPVERRSRATSLYYLGTHLGQAAAYALGGVLLARLATLEPMIVPVVGRVFGWQLLFPIAGLLGLLVLALVLAMKEPPRRELMMTSGEAVFRPSEVASYLRHRARAFAAVLLAPTLVAIGFYSLIVFLPTLLQRVHGWPVDRAGAMLAAVGLPATVVGTLLAGVLADRVTGRGTPGGHARLLAFAILGAAPFCIAVPLAATGNLAIAALAAGLLFFSFGFALPTMAIQVVAPNRMRGQLVGLYIMSTGLLGYGLGPAVTGMLSDLFGSLPRSLAVMLALTYPTAGLITLWSLPAYTRVAAEADARR
jgi:MFS family permease